MKKFYLPRIWSWVRLMSLAAILGAGFDVAVAAPTSATGAAPATAPAAAPKPAPAMRRETINYDAWLVSCAQPVAGGEKKCVATMRVMANPRMPILNWIIGVDKDGHPSTTVAVNSAVSAKGNPSGGLSLKNGLDLKFGDKSAHHMDFASCQGTFCVATAPIDESFVKEAQAGGKVTVTVYAASDNSPIALVIDPKGIEKAVAAAFKK